MEKTKVLINSDSLFNMTWKQLKERLENAFFFKVFNCSLFFPIIIFLLFFLIRLDLNLDLNGKISEKKKIAINNYLKKLKTSPISSRTKERIKEFLEEYKKETKSVQKGSDHFLLNNKKRVVEFLLRMPITETIINIPSESLHKALDKTHFGLKEVKEEIANYLFFFLRKKIFEKNQKLFV